MSADRAAFERIRSQYFADPSKPANLHHGEAAAFLVQQLWGQNNQELRFEGDDGFSRFISAFTDRMRGARRFGHLSMAQIHPSGFAPATFAHFASTLLNNNTIVREVSPIETDLEQETIQWMTDKIAGYDSRNSSGALVSGGTSANVTALMVAREKLSKERYWRGDKTAVALKTEMGHYSFYKNAALLAPNGLIAVENIPLEKGGYRMDPQALQSRLAQLRKDGVPVMAVVANAGMTETGLVDPIAEIADITEEHDLYLHIDAAYGGPYALSRKRSLFSGTPRSNSLTVDPHKNLYTPYSAGAVLFRFASEHSLLGGLNTDGNDYMFKEETANNLGKRRLEGSMGGQAAAATWAVIKTMGVRGLSSILNHTLDVTDHAHKAVEASKYFAAVFRPDLNTLCFSSIDPRLPKVLEDQRAEAHFYEGVAHALEEEKGIYITTTELPIPLNRNHRVKTPVFRVVITNPYTETEHVDTMLDSLQEVWDKKMIKAARAV